MSANALIYLTAETSIRRIFRFKQIPRKRRNHAVFRASSCALATERSAKMRDSGGENAGTMSLIRSRGEQ